MAGSIERLEELDAPVWRLWLHYVEMGLIRESDEDDLIAFLESWHPFDCIVGRWTAVHVWRAMGDLRSEKAVATLVDLLDMPEIAWTWATEDLPVAFGMIGAASMDPLTSYLEDVTRDETSRALAGDGLSWIASLHPQYSAECVEAIAAVLRTYRTQDPSLNSLLIWHLAEMGAMDTVPLMRKVFEEGRADLNWGSWDKVEETLQEHSG
jgi:hypothetical protein